MANRSTLHKSKLEMFKEFVTYLGYEVLEPKGGYEIMRFKIPNHPMGIIFHSKSSVHYSANEAAYPFVRKYILTNKTMANKKECK